MGHWIVKWGFYHCLAAHQVICKAKNVEEIIVIPNIISSRVIPEKKTPHTRVTENTVFLIISCVRKWNYNQKMTPTDILVICGQEKVDVSSEGHQNTVKVA